jgi:hypothetical protein
MCLTFAMEICTVAVVVVCLMGFIDVSFWVIVVSCMRWDLYFMDVSFETHVTWSLSCNIIYLSGLWKHLGP